MRFNQKRNNFSSEKFHFSQNNYINSFIYSNLQYSEQQFNQLHIDEQNSYLNTIITGGWKFIFTDFDIRVVTIDPILYINYTWSFTYNDDTITYDLKDEMSYTILNQPLIDFYHNIIDYCNDKKIDFTTFTEKPNYISDGKGGFTWTNQNTLHPSIFIKKCILACSNQYYEFSTFGSPGILKFIVDFLNDSNNNENIKVSDFFATDKLQTTNFKNSFLPPFTSL